MNTIGCMRFWAYNSRIVSAYISVNSPVFKERRILLSVLRQGDNNHG